jgi:hypothetical protein
MKNKIIFLSFIILASLFVTSKLTTVSRNSIQEFSKFTEENSGFASGHGENPEEAFVDVISKIPKGAFIYNIHTKVSRSINAPQKTSSEAMKSYSNRIPQVDVRVYRSLSLLSKTKKKNWSFDIGWVILS